MTTLNKEDLLKGNQDYTVSEFLSIENNLTYFLNTFAYTDHVYYRTF